MNTPLPVTLIGGYLGAGKTTLVNQLLRQADGLRLAVLVNEFGELPIDEDLIEAQDDDLISIAGGCICCSFGSDLTAALLTLASRTPEPDHVIIEASGVALPAAIAGSVSLLSDYRMDGICVLADAANLGRQLDDEYIGDTVSRQLQDANLVVLTKTDLVQPAGMGKIRDRLTGVCPRTPVVEAIDGKVPLMVMLDQYALSVPLEKSGHDDAKYLSCVLQPSGPVDAGALADAIVQGDFGVVRAKGYVDDTSGRCALIQIVGQTANVTFTDAPEQRGIVCIGPRQVMDRERLLRTLP